MAKFFGFTIVIFALIVVSVNGQGVDSGLDGGLDGGIGESRPASDNVNQLVTRLTPDIIKSICDYNKENCPPSDVKITVNNYKTQVVAGVNYFISITVGEETYHLKIFTQSWTNTEKVHRVQGPKQLTDEISYF